VPSPQQLPAPQQQFPILFSKKNREGNKKGKESF
jgi:hypothetical protein